MSKQPSHAGRMKIKNPFRFRAPFSALGTGCQIIATFGTARLVRKPDGRHELIGGTAYDHADAREWCSIFAHDLIFSSAPRSVASRSFAA
jgi:hypothetical protein